MAYYLSTRDTFLCGTLTSTWLVVPYIICCCFAVIQSDSSSSTTTCTMTKCRQTVKMALLSHINQTHNINAWIKRAASFAASWRVETDVSWHANASPPLLLWHQYGVCWGCKVCIARRSSVRLLLGVNAHLCTQIIKYVAQMYAIWNTPLLLVE